MNVSNQQTFEAATYANQKQHSSEWNNEFDYIVCGSGSSGSVVAGRLAENPHVRVLLLEAGGSDETDMVLDTDRWPMNLGGDLDWGFVTEPNPNLNGRSILYSMGKVLGGGSSINVATWSRGHQADWDMYAAEAGDAGLGIRRNPPTSTAAELKTGLVLLIRTSMAWVEQCMCSRQTSGRFFSRDARRGRLFRTEALSKFWRPDDEGGRRLRRRGQHHSRREAAVCIPFLCLSPPTTVQPYRADGCTHHAHPL